MEDKKSLNEEEKKVLIELKEILVKIKKHNKLYHQLDKPIISDYEFDKLIKEYIKNDLYFPPSKIIYGKH